MVISDRLSNESTEFCLSNRRGICNVYRKLGKIFHNFLYAMSRFYLTEIYIVNIGIHLRTDDALDNVCGGQMLGYVLSPISPPACPNS